MGTVAAWDDDYARLARASSQLRATGSASRLPPGPSRDAQINSIRAGIDRLLNELQHISLTGGEVNRRRHLCENLRTTLVSGPQNTGHTNSSLYESSQQNNNQQQMSQTSMALRQQDGMIDELAVGVSRLKDQTRLIGDEARLHVQLLDDIDNDVERAQEGMEAETRRAKQLKEDKSVWKLYFWIAGLSILLFLLILKGLS
uniref:t-SNARE coiled-coil homology domain-containing protein n=1 Tax=Attheya septentrionalis TaxID=420275 RepID=A0A7S2U747_9STRA|mmetsp:Transcript_1333/g.2387  ORF Transcript_1333/g.2387 Transcript_1333/m.2387 type:complete len:201 (+) Transcript_1333:48-650(+)|eukprot:CAMPEP_0198294978 /NCGR_PEP_ID=MMETSP1449-20131203/25129_1 /TAXON_ID=420275 /ORGANISM="Attheya septentrionalis, Strain CCMP2084" /LENGTH=200 /DNA_ID=CAMNT_0043995109 /DNA_START=31 /DNA_END=633 /DNA_ORIENTATION=+